MLQDTIYDRTNNYKLQNSFYNKFQFLDFNCKKRNLTRHSGSSHICRSNLRLILHMLEIKKKLYFQTKYCMSSLVVKNDLYTMKSLHWYCKSPKTPSLTLISYWLWAKVGNYSVYWYKKKTKKHAFFSVNDSGRNKTDEEAYKVPSYKSCLVSSALNNPQMEYMW